MKETNDEYVWKTSRNGGCRSEIPPPIPPAMTPQEWATEAIKQAEKTKAALLKIPGKDRVRNDNCRDAGDLVHSVIVDEEYSAIASHIDESLRRHIVLGEYIDFVQLLPKDHVSIEEDQRMEIVNRGGMSYWVPVSDRNALAITNIA